MTLGDDGLAAPFQLRYNQFMLPYTYKICFLFTHPKMNLTEVRDTLSKIPDLKPGRLMNFGDQRTTPKGRPLEGTYTASRWGFSFDEDRSWHNSDLERFPVAITSLLVKLLPFKDYLNELSRRGCSLRLILSIGVDSNTGDTLTPTQLAALSDLSMGLGLDLYPPDPPADPSTPQQ